MRANDSFAEVGLAADCGSVRSDKVMALDYADEATRRMTQLNANLIEGEYPSAADGLLVSHEMLAELGCPEAKLGERVTLTVRTDNTTPYEERDFVITGFLRQSAESVNAGAFAAFVSEEYAKTYCEGPEFRFNLAFRLDPAVEIDYDSAEADIQTLAQECGIPKSHVCVNKMYILLALDPGREIKAGCAGLMLGVAFFSPAAILGSMALAFATVWLALVRPKRTIARISAIDAISYNESRGARRGGENAGLRRDCANVSERTLALANITAEKRRSVSTILTMGLSCVLLVVTASCLSSMDARCAARRNIPHGQFQLELAYTFYDKAYPENNLDTLLSRNPLNGDMPEKLREIDGVTDVQCRDMLVIDRDGQLESVIVLNRGDFEFEAEKGGEIGRLDYDEASADDRLIFGWSAYFEDLRLNVGDRVDYRLWDDAESRRFGSPVQGSFGLANGGWAMTEDTCRHFGYTPESNIGTIWVDCGDADCAQVEEALRSLIGTDEHIRLSVFAEDLRDQRFAVRTIRCAVYTLLGVIALIGFMNLANTMILSITTKRREYGILQAVGMTGAQLGRALTIQGMIYTAGTLIVSLGVGIPLGCLCFNLWKRVGGFDINVYHFPLAEVCAIAAVLLLMQLTLSFLLSRNLKRESLIERIRR